MYDHSNFGVELTNGYPEPIRIRKVIFHSLGDREKSGLGDIVGSWPWSDGDRLLQPGGSIFFERTWGFTVDTPNTTMTYRFEIHYMRNGTAMKTVRDLVLTPVD